MTGTRSGGLAVFGGTFDPVHNGHLQSAVEVRDLVGVEVVKMVPSFIPPHRDLPGATGRQRRIMLEMAVRDIPGVEVDAREIERQGVSYTFDTLASFREELPPGIGLYFILGSDAYRTLNEWHRWRELTDVANLVVVPRPGADEKMPEDVRCWAAQKQVSHVRDLGACGGVAMVSLTPVDVSSSALREAFRSGIRPDGRMPANVIDYILNEKIYSVRREETG